MSDETTESLVEPVEAEAIEASAPVGSTAVEPVVAEPAAAEPAEAEVVGTEVVEAEPAEAEVVETEVKTDADDEATEDESVRHSKREETLVNEGEIAADYLEELLDIADLDGDIDTFVEGGRAHVSVLTDGETLVGKNGETLEALQELCRLAVMTETGHRSRLMLDIAGHRERRRVELHGLAREAVEEVKATGEPVRLAPMNPFERKIVHDEVAAAGLTSESEGEEPRRRVVVQPKA